jgi:putative chitinase
MGSTFSDQLTRLSPTASKTIIAGINDNAALLDRAGINTPIRLRHFFARVCVETGGLSTLEENLSYSAQRLTEVWPKRFPTLAAAKPYAKNPAKLAEKVYGGRLGNFKPGDGWAFRGSGLLQNTGRENFEEVEDETGLPVTSQPELLRSFPGALQAATIYWTKRNLNALADKNDVTGICKAVNGGTIGLSDQKTWLAKAAQAWPDGAVIAFPASPAPAPVQPSPAPAAPAAPPASPEPPAPQPKLHHDNAPELSGNSGGLANTGFSRVSRPTAAAGLLVAIGATLMAFWHHITDLFWSIF